MKREEHVSVDSEKSAANGCDASAPTFMIRSTPALSSEEERGSLEKGVVKEKVAALSVLTAPTPASNVEKRARSTLTSGIAGGKR